MSCIEWRGLRFNTGYGRLTNSERARVNGHVYDEANTLRFNGRRNCRICWNAGQRRRYWTNPERRQQQIENCRRYDAARRLARLGRDH